MDLPGPLTRTAATVATHVARVVAPSGTGPGFGAILAAIGLPGDAGGRQGDVTAGKNLPERQPVDPDAMAVMAIVPPPLFLPVVPPSNAAALRTVTAPRVSDLTPMTPSPAGTEPQSAGPVRAPDPLAITPPTPPAEAAAPTAAPVADAPSPTPSAVASDLRIAPPALPPIQPAAMPAPTNGAPVAVDAEPTPAEPPVAGPPPIAQRPRMAGEVLAPRIAIAAPPAESRPVADKADDPKRREPDPAGIAGLSSIDPAAQRVVTAATAPDQGALDTQDDGWMQGMIDRIETLRGESGGMGQTRIRLSPDALGGVEIRIDATDDGVQIRFASDHPDAARLLADAQPRLAELAEARGLKLGGMHVDVGQQQQPRRDPPAQDSPARFTRPAPSDVPADPVHDDIRIA